MNTFGTTHDMNMNIKNIEPVLFPASALAKRWNCHPITIRRLIASGKLASVRVGARAMIPLTAIVDAECNGGVGKPRRGPSLADESQEGRERA